MVKALINIPKIQPIVGIYAYTGNYVIQEGPNIIQDSSAGETLRICKSVEAPCEEEDSYNYVSVSIMCFSVFIIGLSLALRRK